MQTLGEGMMVAQAVIVAVEAHRFQMDKANQPYILHPIRVALSRVMEVYGDVRTHRAQTSEEMCVSLLHDVIEDTEFTEREMRELFPAVVCDAVMAMTHREGESNEDYWARVKANPMAQRVKRADIEDNRSRLDALFMVDPKAATRLTRKYQRAVVALGGE